MLRSVFICILALQFFAVGASAVPVDFDQDGISDTVYLTASGSNRIWTSVATAENGAVISETFGITGDGPAIAHWLGGTLPYLGFVRRSGTELNWKILLGDGIIREEKFGLVGDTYIAGADFNGNGAADAGVVRIEKKRLVWEIKPDLFTEPGETKRIVFGKEGDRAFFVNPGGGEDWIASFGAVKKKSGRKGKKRKKKKSGGKKKKKNNSEPKVTTLLQMRSVTGSETRSTKLIPGTWAGTRPFALQQPDGSDILVFTKTDESDISVYAYDLDGNEISQLSFQGQGSVAIGDFLSGDSGEEIAIKLSTEIRIYNPVTGATSTRANVGGELMDEINFGQL